MKKLLFVLQSLGSGGAERVISILSESLLANAKYDIYVLTLFKGGEFYSLADGIRLTRLNGETDSKLITILKIRKYVKSLNPDVLISFQCHVNVKVLVGITGLRGFRRIVSERNDPAVWKDRWALNKLRNYLYAKCDCIVFQTEDARNYFPQRVRSKSVVIPNPIKDNLPLPFEGEREKRIVNFCRLAPQKHLELLLDAYEDFKEVHPEYTLEIYGDGPDREKLESIIIDKGLEGRARIYPAVADIHNKILDAYMFVSTSDYEGISNSMLEAMAIGLPVICTDCPCGGARMVINNMQDGVLIPVNNKKKVVEAMEKLADDYDMAKKMGQAALGVREKFRSDVIMRKWIAVIEVS